MTLDLTLPWCKRLMRRTCLSVRALANGLERLALQHRRRLAVGVAAGLEPGVLERDLHQVAVELVAVLQVLLVLAELHLVERRLGDVDVAALDELGHLPEQEREQQG